MGYWEQIGEDNRRWRAEAPMRRARRIRRAKYAVNLVLTIIGFMITPL